jgi:hypothetical protein
MLLVLGRELVGVVLLLEFMYVVVVRMSRGQLLGECNESTKDMPSWHQGSTAHCSTPHCGVRIWRSDDMKGTDDHHSIDCT